ncbi:MAG: Clp protease N-terminal domain-containing protein, partial [Hyphomicrobiaceae bacterium]
MSSNIVDALGRIPLSANLMATLTRAATYAGAQQHREVALEHLLLALTEDPDAALVMSISSVEIDTLKGDISSHIGRMEASVTQSPISELRIASELKDILQAAAAAAEGRRNEIDGAIVLAAIVGEGKSASAGLLRAHGMTFETAIRALQQAAALQAQRAEAAAQQTATAAAPAAKAQTSPPAQQARPSSDAEPRAPISHHNQTSAEDILESARQRVQGRIAPGLSEMRPPAKAETQAAGSGEAASREAASKSDALAAAEAETQAEFERISAATARPDADQQAAAAAEAEPEPPTYMPQPAPPAQRPSPPGAVRPRPPEPAPQQRGDTVDRPPPAADRSPAPTDEAGVGPGQATMPPPPGPPPAPRPPAFQRPPVPQAEFGILPPGPAPLPPPPATGPATHQAPLPPGRPPVIGLPTGTAPQRGVHTGAVPGQPQPP